MISIIICNRDRELLKGLKNNVRKTLQNKYEFVVIDNKDNKYSLTEAYNLGAEKAKYNYVVFVHEDVRFLTKNWGDVIINLLKKKDIGLVGIAGSSYLPKNGIWWNAGRPYIKGQVVHKWFDKEVLYKYSRIKKKVLNKIKFDTRFDGFHFYDIDFSFRVSRTYRVMVTCDILIKHLRKKDYDNYREIFVKKFGKEFPCPKIKTGKFKNWVTQKYTANNDKFIKKHSL